MKTRNQVKGGKIEVMEEKETLKATVTRKIPEQLLEAIQEVNVYRGMARSLIKEHDEMMEVGDELKNKLTTLMAKNKESMLDHLRLNPHDQALVNQSLANRHEGDGSSSK